MTQKYTAIESFCGAGGLSLGLKAAGFDVKLAFDLNEFAVATYNSGVGHNAIVADASKISVNSILEKTGLKSGELDLFSGGPPCQGFSKQRRGAHLWEDPRNLLIGEYIRFVKGLQPKSFILENVAIFGQKRGEKHLKDLEIELENYTLYPNIYNAADFGLAQTRERFVLVGIRNDIDGDFVVPKATHRQWKTVRDVIADIPEPPSDCTVHPDYYNHQKGRISKENELRISFVPQGGGWQDIPWEHRLPCHQKVDVNSGGWPDVYGRLHWDKQCPTITGGFDNFSRGRFGHPEQNRAITPREAARIQGFPDSIKFMGNRHEVRYQIGNAVPPPLAQAIGRSIIKTLNGEKESTKQLELAM
ncbi:DNA cytosine methyltransferase [Vibrio vulnificus]|uniref:Cytosine-specific methyltransferase n=1 Tax=Vibrio vulnificus TaxID=672 RepID=A0A2S3R6J8_VIBVL|nr:DNA cytosine methyltransferase [Vibrio vulnificus]POB49331.1 DNA (cytosine-5-)-methyltransferase [Vibrio vulnificus]